MSSIAQGVPARHPAILALQRARDRLKELEGYLTWEDQLFSNTALSAADKLTLRATRRAAEHSRTHDDQGRARINLGIIAEQIGVSPDTVSRRLAVLESAGAITKETRPELQDSGDLWRRVYVAITPKVLEHPRELAPEQPRNHGGKRYICPACGSATLAIRKKIILVCPCGHQSIIEETETHQADEDTDPQPQDAGTFNTKTPSRILRQGIIKPVSPPDSAADHLTAAPGLALMETTMSHEAPGRAELSSELPPEAITLLLDIAGPSSEHIEMARGDSEKKYYTAAGPITPQHARLHLEGHRTYGAALAYPDGAARAICYDADEPEAWVALTDAARNLAEAGYMPLLEPSPAGRGGHLWLIYSGLVDAYSARQHAATLAPGLAAIGEFFPGPANVKKPNRVRLPGGRYTYQNVTAWCELVAVATGERARDGTEAARLLLDSLTPASLVPQIVQEPLPETQEPPSRPQRAEPPPANALDDQWHARYGTEQAEQPKFDFAFTARYAAAWANSLGTIADELPEAKRDYGRATWRNETDGSVAIGEGEWEGRWTDFGASARRPDGSPDNGDLLELQQRITKTPKGELLRQIGKRLVAKARADLDAAARDHQPLPAWLEPIITEKGRARYDRVRAASHHQPDGTGGLTGFQTPPAEGSGAQPEQSPAKSPLGVPSEQAQQLMETYHLHYSAPCPACACELQRELYDSLVCVRCLPPKNYSAISDDVDQLYPRRQHRAFGSGK